MITEETKHDKDNSSENDLKGPNSLQPIPEEKPRARRRRSKKPKRLRASSASKVFRRGKSYDLGENSSRKPADSFGFQITSLHSFCYMPRPDFWRNSAAA